MLRSLHAVQGWYSPRFMTRTFPKWLRAAWLPGAILLTALIGVAVRYGESARFAEMIAPAEPVWPRVAAVPPPRTHFFPPGIFEIGTPPPGPRRRVRPLVPPGPGKAL